MTKLFKQSFLSDFSFEKFCDFPSNASARTQAGAFAQSNLKSDCLIITGNAGAGKSHLAGAMMNQILEEHPSLGIEVGAFDFAINSKWSEEDQAHSSSMRQFALSDILVWVS